MKNLKIKLNSKHLKAGDKIIRTSGAYSTSPFTYVEGNSTHVKLEDVNTYILILPIETWNEGWVRYNIS